MSLGDYLKRLFKNLSPPASAAELDRKAELAKQAQLAAAKAQAAIVDGYIDDVNTPTELMARQEFRSGVVVLSNSDFTSRELLKLTDDPSKALWQMGLIAVAQRDTDSALVAPLLSMFDEGGPWHKYFVMQALPVHTPVEQSLAGEIIFLLQGSPDPWHDLLIKNAAPLLTQRLADGEKPSFGELLEKLASQYDRVIVDSPPVLPVADARIIATKCDVTLLTLRVDRSTRKRAIAAHESLQSVSARILGAVLNDMPKGIGYGYGGYHGGRYGYGSGGYKSKPQLKPDVPRAKSGA